jgi:hypothetical protein
MVLEETYTAACALGLQIILHPWIATVRIWLQPQAGGKSTGREDLHIGLLLLKNVASLLNE